MGLVTISLKILRVTKPKNLGKINQLLKTLVFASIFSKQNEFVQTARQDDCLPFNQPSQPSQYDLPTDSFHNKMGSWSGTSILNFAANINRSTPDEFGERGSKRHSSLNRAFTILRALVTLVHPQ